MEGLGCYRQKKVAWQRAKKLPLTRPNVLCIALSWKASGITAFRFLPCLTVLYDSIPNVSIWELIVFCVLESEPIRQGRRYTTPFWPLKLPTLILKLHRRSVMNQTWAYTSTMSNHYRNPVGEHHWRDLCFSLLEGGEFFRLFTLLINPTF